MEQRGATVTWQVTQRTEIRAKIDDSDTETARFTAGEVDAQHRVSPNWEVSAGLRVDSRDLDTTKTSNKPNEDGDRTDVQLRADYTPDPDGSNDWSAYGYAQGSVNRSGSRTTNDRFGLGGRRRISKRFALRGEASVGDGGLGALIGGDYQGDDQTNTYLTYQLDTDRTDNGYRARQGVLSTGVRTRYSDNMSVFGEERLQHGDGPSGLTHAYGLDLAPDEHWTYGIRAEAGELSDRVAGELRRRAVGFSIGYHKDKTKYAGNLEYRRETGSAADRRTWLWRNNLGYQLDQDWRFLGRLNLSYSDASGGAFFDGDFVETVSGFAFRPAEHDRLNLLFKYTYFYNLPSPGQLDANSQLAEYSQRSHIMSIDGIYDLVPWLSLGGKYAYRLGEMRDSRLGGPWLDSQAQLGIIRANLHWVHQWDAVIEDRTLYIDATEDTKSGILATLYRHVGKHLKVGAGYNFTDFSDDLTDLSYTSEGWFVNIVSTM